jgi:hypothetical protein
MIRSNSHNLYIKINTPVKRIDCYHFLIEVTLPGLQAYKKTIGFDSPNYQIPHHEIFDTYYPLMWITRNGGPLFKSKYSSAVITSDFPLHSKLVDFFVNRARNFGLKIDVSGQLFDRTYDVTTSGSLLLFGGGKDSRLLLGTLAELGHNVTPISANGFEWASGVKNSLTYKTNNFSMADRIVPALMLRPSTIYHGSGLGEVHLTLPWQQYYDISSPNALIETASLLKGIGWDVKFEAPQSVLPYNVTQNILARRYPTLYQDQLSVRRNEHSDKNLHISLIKKYHHLSHANHCDDDTFDFLLKNFLSKHLDFESSGSEYDYGFHGSREIIELEMRALISRLIQNGTLDALPMPIDVWNAKWIDYIHLYVYSCLDSDLLSIYKQYADVLDVKVLGSTLPQSLSILAE